MKTLFSNSLIWCVALLLAAPAVATEPQLDVKQAAPQDVILYIYGKKNPEREYQKQHWQEVFDTIEETRIGPRALEIITSRMGEDELAKANEVLDTLKTAIAPMDCEALMGSEEIVYAQRMQGMFTHHLVVFRMTPEAAAGFAEGARNLFALAESGSEGEVSVETTEDGPVRIDRLVLPGDEVPFTPTVAHSGDVFVFSSAPALAEEAMQLMQGKSTFSKFADPRLQEALTHLPEPEDALIFYDGKQQFAAIHKLFDEITEKAGEDPEAKRWIGLAQKIVGDMDILDYELTVEYTEENRNCYDSFGRLQPGYEDSVLMKVFGSGEEFEDWQSWVPEDALSFSLWSGVNLHAIYDYVEHIVAEEVPEAQEGWQKFKAWQDEIDFHIDDDLLKPFSGECVSVRLPASSEGSGNQSFTAIRCHDSEKIQGLLDRVIAMASEHPFLSAQQIAITPCEELEGFSQLTAPMLEMFQARPVIGFRDGWMMMASSPEAVQRVLATKSGEAPSVSASETFQRFNLPVEGPVAGIGYSNLAASTRETAQMVTGAGAIAPMIIGMLGAQADPEKLKPVQEFLALLPDLGKIIAKMDFFEAKMWVAQAGPTEDTWTQRSVIEIRKPTE